jgi:hypothetical protein
MVLRIGHRTGLQHLPVHPTALLDQTALRIILPCPTVSQTEDFQIIPDQDAPATPEAEVLAGEIMAVAAEAAADLAGEEEAAVGEEEDAKKFVFPPRQKMLFNLSIYRACRKRSYLLH